MKNTTIQICVKCSDAFSAIVREDSKILGEYDGYVPRFFSGNDGEDYVSMKIDVETGKIVGWKAPTQKEMKDFLAKCN